MFRWVLGRLANEGLLKGNTIGVDVTTLEANAAVRSIVRRDTAESYDASRACRGSGDRSGSSRDAALVNRVVFEGIMRQSRNGIGMWH